MTPQSPTQAARQMAEEKRRAEQIQAQAFADQERRKEMDGKPAEDVQRMNKPKVIER